MSMALTRGGKATHINGTATTTPAALVANNSQESARIIVNNTDATNLLQLSFDGGVTFFNVRPNSTVDLPIQTLMKDVRVRSSAATVAYQILWISVV